LTREKQETVVPYTRRPNGEPVFGEPEVFTVGLYPGEIMPGFVLLRALLDSGELPFC
jgi:hypothetical protein